MKVLVTGASGFVGTATCTRLVIQGMDVLGVGRDVPAKPVQEVEYRLVGELGPNTDWRGVLVGVDTIVHCAARVHVMRETVADPATAFHTANVLGTLQLARQAAAQGVRRFVFLSSVKVHGEGGLNAYRETDVLAPRDAYGVSKYEAEVGLREIATDVGIELVVVRPPLVYGPGVKANFRLLMQALSRGIPLPLGAIHNLRSLVGLGNLVDLIATCIEHPRAANETFLVSDGEDLSTTELTRRLAVAMDRPARLVSVPGTLLTLGLNVLGKGDLARRLCGTLLVDINKARRLLGWVPPIRVDEGLRETAEYYLRHQC